MVFETLVYAVIHATLITLWSAIVWRFGFGVGRLSENRECETLVYTSKGYPTTESERIVARRNLYRMDKWV